MTMTKEFYTELCHSAKGTSWKKKDHKYIKLINGKYYYATKTGIDAIKEAQSRNSEDNESLTNAKKEYKRYTNIAKSNSQASKDSNARANWAANNKFTKPLSSRFKSNAKTYNAKANEALVSAKKYKKQIDMLEKNVELRKTAISHLTISYQIKNWVNNLFSKFKK